MKTECERKVDEYRRQLLRDGLAQCKEAQVMLFNRMYGSVDDIADDQIDIAFRQIENTIKKNKNND